MLSVVAARYARALVDVITAPASKIDSVRALSELHSIQELIASAAELRGALASPAVAPSKKRAVMARLVAPLNLLPQVRNFLFIVIDHRRVGEFGSIVEAVETLLDQRLGFIGADIASARELSPAHQSALQGQVESLTGKKAKLKFTINPALIAGVVAHVGSKVYDGSVRGQLDRLRTQLGRG